MSLKNKFNTTPNGNSVINPSDIIDQPTTLVIEPTKTPYLDNIFFYNPTITTFVLMPGNYNISNVLKFKKPGISLIGKTTDPKDVHIFQTNEKDGIAINSDNITFQGISVHCTSPKQVCFTVAGANNTVVSYCHFYGALDTFCIYYAGPPSLIQGQSTLDGYTNYILDSGNVFYNNIVYTQYAGDSVSISLQYKTQTVGNFIRSGKMAVYMCRTCNIYNNVITDSASNAIYVSLPSDNLSIIGNKIYNSHFSGVKISDQLEHGQFVAYDYNILMKHNVIYGSNVYGIELNYVFGINIVNNAIVSGQSIGIYSYGGNNVIVQNNKIAYFKFGIYFEQTGNSAIKSNNFTSTYPNFGNNCIKVVNDKLSVNNVISGNTIRGKLQYDVIVSGNQTNVSSGNTISTYYSIDNERSIYTVT
jgi:parallel beta-helix repeat protein